MDQLRDVVREFQRLARLLDPRFQLFRLEDQGLLAEAQRRERRSIDPFHRDARAMRIAHEIMDADDVPVRQLAALARLGLQFLEAQRIEPDDLREELERDVLPHLLVMGQPDHAHAPAAQDAVQLVPAEDDLPAGKPGKGRPQIKIVLR